MKTMSFEKMEEIEGGNPTVNCLALFAGTNQAWAAYMNDPSTVNWIVWQTFESAFYTYCIQPV
ncbi:MAG TPA: hypothetical protein PLM56_14500 [Cyclobacteriaceae bacterium]|jgi:hypothetical protein|nr:hypothetical protein [Cytophagales bacterium]HNT50089.1 hypothetical protein [Cyclobacteriaceae bacterium]HRE68118.1 hypothetical protein [Cyclobacteriaceae bacterium]HRF34713.1 hypothetical protein [Cyclobacteriaceae bacterium]